MSLQAGQTLSHYRIVRQLGAGGMGEVYLAEDMALERRVALKVLAPGLATQPIRLARFEREARAVAALNHPHIVTIYSVEEADGVRLITMELVEGESLASSLRPGGLPPDKVCEIGVALADALSAAHEKGIVHRDLKPANVMLTSEGRVKVLDFGVAKLGAAPSGDDHEDGTRAATLTSDGAIVGTVPYMSPEQLQDLPVDNRSDLFSLGVLLYELAAGERPFVGGNAAAVASSILRDRPAPLVEVRANVPQELSRIVAHCLRKDPLERYQTARDVYNDLRELRRELESGSRDRYDSGPRARARSASGTPGLAASPIAVGDPASAPRASAFSTTAPGPSTSSPIHRAAASPRLGAAVVAIAVLITAGAWMARRSLPRPWAERAAERPAREGRSVVVMPFADLSPEPGQEYFTIGLAEELQNSLGRVPGLRVAGYRSRRGEDARAWDPRQLAEQMHVGAALQGSVTKAGTRVRIRVQLVELPGGQNLWSDTYDRTLEDILAVQDEIARAVAAALQLTLFADTRGRRSEKPEAHNLVLQAQYLRNTGTAEDLQRALELLRRAAAIDPENARVFAEMSRLRFARAADGVGGDEEYGESWRAATRAVELDPQLADAHQALGWFSMAKNWDWAAADASFKKALVLEPRNVRALRSAAALAGTLGRFDEAVALAQRAIEIEPANAAMYYNLALLRRKAGQLDRALVDLRRALELDPRLPQAHFQLGATHLLKGSVEDAMREFEQERDEVSRTRGLAIGYHSEGRPARSEKHLQQLIAGHRDDSAREIAQVYAWRGEKDRAFEWLDRAFAQRDAGLCELKGDALFRNVQDDPRWKAFLTERLKLPN